MDDLEPKSSNEAAVEQEGLRQQFDSLRQMVLTLLVLVIVVSATFNIYLWRQVRYARGDLMNYRRQAEQVISEYQKTAEPAIKDFIDRLSAFSKSPQADRAFTELMKNAGLTNLSQLSTNSGPASTPPVAPLPQSKQK